MPWFPDFVGAVELARRQTRAEGEADPVGVYLDALNSGDPYALRNSWPGEVVVYDPHAGEVRGHRQLRQFVHRNQVWLAERHARIERVAATCVDGRAVVELLAHLTDGGRETAWPVAVVAESPDDRSVVFRTYCSQLPVDRRRHVRPPILPPVDVQPGDVVGRHLAALQAGDTAAAVGTFTAQGYVREPVEALLHRGAHELRAYFDRCFRRRRRRRAALRRHRRRRALRARVQLRQLGSSPGGAPGRTGRLRAGPRRPAGRGPPLRRHRVARLTP